ncbi:MAG: protein-L-isoaspartate(D-aspartate) O-methyltransferase [Chloroflexi bacterium]|nr:protein-L-isoaspartate(D-aspartate) O-methyltransferase [Chloroflexota bacterium]
MALPRLATREQLVAVLRKAGVRDERVLEAIRRVPREAFIPERLRPWACDNIALPIGDQQTISQPYVVACMIEALHLAGTEHVLEIGTGSGYGAAVAAEMAGDVVTIEILASLAKAAAPRLKELAPNVTVIQGDGSLGWPEFAPYDAIIITANSPTLPRPVLRQLTNHGRLVAPIGSLKEQQLVVVERSETRFTTRDLGPVRFVPLIGAGGFQLLDPARRN